MKVFVIPDIHQTNLWVKAAEEALKDADKIIFLGDYVDSFDSKSLENTEWSAENTLLKLIDFKKKNPDKVILLCGNHDFSYLAKSRDGQSVSGHQWKHHDEISKILHDNISSFKAMEVIDDVAYSHAGVSKVWSFAVGAPTVEKINEKFQNVSEDWFNWNGYYDGYGNEPQQTPFWIRPNALIYSFDKENNMKFSKQVVGHTEMKKPSIVDSSIIKDMSKDSFLLLCDTLERTGFQWVNDGIPEIHDSNKKD